MSLEQRTSSPDVDPEDLNPLPLEVLDVPPPEQLEDPTDQALEELEAPEEVTPDELIAIRRTIHNDEVKNLLVDLTKPLLSATQETELITAYQEGAAARQCKQHIDFSLLSPGEQQTIEDLILTGELAQEALVESNLRLVISIIKRYTGQEFEDRFQEGCIGLLKAIQKFDLKRGTRFSTLATWWIRQQVSYADIKKSRTIRLPYHIAIRIKQLRNAISEFEKKYSREPNVGDLTALGYREEDIALNINVGDELNSLDMPANADGDPYLEFTPEEEHETDSFDEVDNQLVVNEYLNIPSLTDRERDILRRRFGLDPYPKAQTLEEIGEDYGRFIDDKWVQLSRERIRQIQESALEKIEDYIKVREIEADIKARQFAKKIANYRD